MIDIKKLVKALWNASFPGMTSTAMPTVGPAAGDARYQPSSVLDKLGKALAPAMIAAVGKANPAMPMSLVDVHLAPQTILAAIPSPAATMAVNASATRRLRRAYGGVAWSYGHAPASRGIYLVTKDRDPATPLEETRKIYRFDPEADEVEAEFTTLLGVDSLGKTTRLNGLSFAGGMWRSFGVFVPPQLRGAVPHNIMSWGVTGAGPDFYAGARGMGIWGEGARPSFAWQLGDPYGGGPFVLVEQGWMYQLRDRSHDANFQRSFVTMEDSNARPMSMDIADGGDPMQAWEYVVCANPSTGEVSWFNVEQWNGSGSMGDAGSAISQHKRFVAFDAVQSGGIVDLALDLSGNVLWILTNGGRELQRYDLDAYMDEDAPPNPAKGIVVVNWPDNLALGSREAVSFQLLDMWGQPTLASGQKCDIVAMADQGKVDNGDGAADLQTSCVSLDGIVACYYKFNDGATGDEKLMAALVG